MEQFEIVAVRYKGGKLTNFKLNNGQELDYQQAIEMGKQGQIKGIDVVDRASGMQFIRSQPDGNLANNLDMLPEF
jgi:hypothetical protein